MNWLNHHFRVICALLGTVMLGLLVHIASSTENPKAKMERAENARRNQAWYDGTAACRTAVENAAKYDLRWKDSWPSLKFASGGKVGDRELFFGDKAEAQNGFGGWVRVHYQCVFDPKTKQAVASIEAGRRQ